MSWTTARLVEFQHCDPAGIVFYPRYFEMINSVVEQFFRDHIGYSFGAMHLSDQMGVPTARIEAEFHAPSRLEDILTFTLSVPRVGNSSAGFTIKATCGDEARMTVQSTIVQINISTGRSTPWSAPVRAKLADV